MRIQNVAVVIMAAIMAAACCPGEGSAAAGGGISGRPAPAFDLPLLGGGGFVSSGQLFEGSETVFLVFWDAGCQKCAESLRGCEDFYRRTAGGGIEMVGIAGGETDDLVIKGIVESAGVTFRQLRDRGRRAGAAYGVEAATFAIVMVDAGGSVAGMVYGTEGDPSSVMEEMLISGPPGGGQAGGALEAAREARASAAAAGFTVRGLARIKFLSVDSRGDDATGPYGEPLRQGNSLLQRYEIEMARDLGRHLRIGGLLRATNEGIEVLRSGPEYYDSQWGSLFVEGDYGRFGFRLGYFTMHMTPLTMMRWDWDDNPRTGGDAGCGCGAAGGILIVESLEELGPDLTFEGALVRYLAGDFEMKAFYAMPRRARDTQALEWQFGGEEMAAYSLEIFGLQGLWRRPDARTGSAWSAGVHLIGTREDPKSIDPEALGYVSFARYDSEILTLTANVPVIRRVDLRGEWIVLNRARGYNLGLAHDEEERLEGSGGYAGIVIEAPGLYSVNLDYLRTGDEYYSPFGALSYEPGRHGQRAGCRLGLPGGLPALMVFYKRLWELEEPIAGAEKDNLSFTGITLDADSDSGIGGSLSYIDRREWRGGDIEDFSEKRRAYTASLRYRFGPGSWIEGMYQRIENRDTVPGEYVEAETDIYSVYFRTAF